MRILYVSDLDGTLLDNNQKIPSHSINIINELISRGLLFTYATARSFATAKKVTDKLMLELPVITNNGAAIVDSTTGANIVDMSFHTDFINEIKTHIERFNMTPIIYAKAHNLETCSWLNHLKKPAIDEYLSQPHRQNDPRLNPVASIGDFPSTGIFYVIWMGTYEELLPIFLELKNNSRCQLNFEKQLYGQYYWLEIMPIHATKANAILTLKSRLHCDKVICFGDGINDIQMFKAADYSYAVSNANNQLKSVATDVIMSNEQQGVALWLQENGNLK